MQRSSIKHCTINCRSVYVQAIVTTVKKYKAVCYVLDIEGTSAGSADEQKGDADEGSAGITPVVMYSMIGALAFSCIIVIASK